MESSALRQRAQSTLDYAGSSVSLYSIASGVSQIYSALAYVKLVFPLSGLVFSS